MKHLKHQHNEWELEDYFKKTIIEDNWDDRCEHCNSFHHKDDISCVVLDFGDFIEKHFYCYNCVQEQADGWRGEDVTVSIKNKGE